MWADFGVDDGFGLEQILRDAGAGAFDLIMHAGDWAYDLSSDESANGNFFMNRAHPYASKIPVLPAPGNHEAGANFSEFIARHSAVAAYSNTGTALYYSFEANAGTPTGVHVLTFNSETYIDGGIEAMLNWIQADLASVDRARTPWVIAQSHKLFWLLTCNNPPPICSASGRRRCLLTLPPNLRGSFRSPPHAGWMVLLNQQL